MKVGELIKALKKYDQERDICILDADTGWSLNIKGIKLNDEYDKKDLCIFGDYLDRYKVND